jgi:hypothetical protein
MLLSIVNNKEVQEKLRELSNDPKKDTVQVTIAAPNKSAGAVSVSKKIRIRRVRPA